MFFTKSSQFKLHYQFREYHFSPEQLRTTEPQKSGDNCITNIRNSLNTFCLALTFHVSLALSSRQTAFALREIFNIPISYQTVINYSKIASYYCNKFNKHFKGKPDYLNAGDETYIKVSGEHKYVFIIISVPSLVVHTYHVADYRDAQNAIASLNDVIQLKDDGQNFLFVFDGNPAYQSAINYFNMKASKLNKYEMKKVIGLQNLDQESTEYRYLKQIIERFNRTLKFHLRAASGFKNKEGAVALITLVITYYNFLRPHSSLNYKPPLVLDLLKDCPTIQSKWAVILNKGIDLDLAS